MTKSNAPSGATGKLTPKFALIDIDQMGRMQRDLAGVAAFLDTLEQDTTHAIQRVRSIGIHVDEAGIKRLADVVNAKDVVEKVLGTFEGERRFPQIKDALCRAQASVGGQVVHIIGPSDRAVKNAVRAIRAGGNKWPAT